MLGLARRHPSAAALAAYLAIAAAATWPLLARFATHIGGDLGDHWHTLWGFWWWHDALSRGASPFFCDVVRWPWGAPLWFQTWDLPALLATQPFWPFTPAIPEVALFNATLFASYPLAGFTLYLLARELWGGELGPFLAGALYTVSAYHFGHALGHAHVLAIEWSPLYLLGLTRTARRGGAGGPLLAAGGLALAATASLYHLAFCAVASAVLLAAWWRSDRPALASAAFLRRLLLLAGAFLALTGWLWWGMLRAARAEPYAGAHDAVRFSADLVSFLVPNAGSAWRDLSAGAWRRFTGSEAESAGYVGWVALGLAGWAFARARASRPWLAVAGAGFLLALGPYLHVLGKVYRGVLLPYGWLERLVPGLRFSGMPMRFSWLVTLGVAVAAGAAFAELCRRGRRGAVLACALAALALAESWPHQLTTSSYPAPRFLRDLAGDPERWAVLDASAPSRQLWHQVLHHHPQVGGDLTRVPERLERLLTQTPVLRPFFGDGRVALGPAEAVRGLQELKVRFVIVERSRLAAARALGLPVAWQGDGIVVFEVPARVG